MCYVAKHKMVVVAFAFTQISQISSFFSDLERQRRIAQTSLPLSTKYFSSEHASKDCEEPAHR
jgi:hypothetical protein